MDAPRAKPSSPEPPPSGRVVFGGAVGLWLQSCAVMAIALALCLSFSAAAGRLGQRLLGEDHAGLVLLGMALYALLAAIGAGAMRWAYRRLKPSGFAAAVVAGYALVQLALIFAGGAELQWTGDASLLHRHVRILAEQGYALETLGPLSGSYDYQVWARRAVPFYILIQRLAGDAFPMAIQGFNALVMALAALLTWRIATVLLGSRAAACALALHVLMPWRIFTHLDLAHHILGGFYYTLGVWLLVEWHQPRRTLPQRAGLALVSFGLLPLMHLEGGIDFVYVAAVAGTIGLAWLMGKFALGRAAASAAVLLIVPLASTALFTGPLDRLLDEADRYHYDSGILAWSTRGWSVSTGGQYDGNYEQLDVLTPQGQKKPMLLQLLASQAYYNPAAVAFRQLPTKAAKYFMVGYASGFEEILQWNRKSTLRILYVGARSLFLLVLLPLAIGGSLIFLVGLCRRDGLYFLLPFAAIVAAYVVFGEADPRYSAYVHTYVCLAAGAFVAWLRAADSAPEFRGKDLLAAIPVPLLSCLLLFALWGAAIFAVRPRLRPWAMWDLRQATVAGNAPRALSAAEKPFEICLPPVPQAPTWGTVHLPIPPDAPATFSFYALPVAGLSASHGTPAVLRRQTAAGPKDEPFLLPARVTVEFAAGDPKSFELLSAASPAPFPLTIGYANLRGRE